MKVRIPGLTLPKHLTRIGGAAALTSIGLHYLLTAIDRFGLTIHRATAQVVGKGYRKAGNTYITCVTPVVLPPTAPDSYLLLLDMDGKHTRCEVDKALFEALNLQDRVQVTYRRRRLTDGVEIIDCTYIFRDTES